MNNFDHILLEPVQMELLIKLVEISRSIPSSRRDNFFIEKSMDGDFLKHSGILEEKKLEIYIRDNEVLKKAGLINFDPGSSGLPIFDVSPLGYKY